MRLLVACADGFFYTYDVNTQTGGECRLLSQTSIQTQNDIINPIGKELNSINTEDNHHHNHFNHDNELYNNNNNNTNE